MIWLLLAGCLINRDLYEERLGDFRDDDGDGFTEAEGDCDDSDPRLRPFGDELCDDLDNDCDGLVDDRDPDTLTAEWFEDSDHDGVGGPSLGFFGCEVPVDAVLVPGDCDDRDPMKSPELVEVCGDGMDNDCSGSTADCRQLGELSTGDAQATIVGGGEFSRFGDWLTTSADLDTDGREDLVVLSRGESNSEVQVFLEWETGLSTSSDASVVIESGAGEQRFAWVAVSKRADPIGSPMLIASTGEAEALGFLAPLEGIASLEQADARFFAEGVEGNVGGRATSGGDLGGDASDDLVFAAPLDDLNSGVVWLVLGPTTSGRDTNLWDDSYGQISGHAGEGAGWALSAQEDLDGDGLSDIVVGAPGLFGTGDEPGRVLVFLGGDPPGPDLDDADAEWLGEAPGDAAGLSVAGAGDTNGDGRGDLLIGAPFNSAEVVAAGRAYLLTSALGGGSLETVPDRLSGSREQSLVGVVVDGNGDLDADGVNDIAIGTFGAEPGLSSVFVQYGPVSGSVVDDSADLRVGGFGHSGIALAAIAKDLNGDGTGDLVVAAPFDSTIAEEAGAVFLFPGLGE